MTATRPAKNGSFADELNAYREDGVTAHSAHPDPAALREQCERLAQRLPATARVIGSCIERGLNPGAQLFVKHRGAVVASWGGGLARPDATVTTDTLFPILCCTKILGVIAFGRLWERGAWTPDTPVGEHVPEFARLGKERITFRHLLTHTTGLYDDVRFDPIRLHRVHDADEALARVCDLELASQTAPGRRTIYSPYWAWFLLSVAVERVTGLTYQEYVEREIIGPLGLRRFFLAMTEEAGAAASGDIGYYFHTASSPPLPPFYWTAPPRAVMAGAGAMASIGDVATLLDVVASGGRSTQGDRLLENPTATALASRVRSSLLDPTYIGYVDWSLGLTAEPRHFGAFCSPRTVGQKANSSAVVFADLEEDLVVGCYSNGSAGRTVSEDRDREIADAVYLDLGLATDDRRGSRIVEVAPASLSST